MKIVSFSLRFVCTIGIAMFSKMICPLAYNKTLHINLLSSLPLTRNEWIKTQTDIHYIVSNVLFRDNNDSNITSYSLFSDLNIFVAVFDYFAVGKIKCTLLNKCCFFEVMNYNNINHVIIISRHYSIVYVVSYF